ncbi:MAG: S-layer homology domain-containing protein, partial [Candidatus Limnocylindrales bacterium]
NYFPDVTMSNPFHDDISAMADAGITAGFMDGNYHPADPVTRQAMAAFLHRGLGRVGLVVDSAPLTGAVTPIAGALSTSLLPVRSITVNVPGSTNGFMPDQRVHLVGRVTFLTSMDTGVMGQGCPCEFKAVIRDMLTMANAAGQGQTFESTTATPYTYSFDVEAIFSSVPGPHTYQLEVMLKDKAMGTGTSSFLIDPRSSLSATTYPFDT